MRVFVMLVAAASLVLFGSDQAFGQQNLTYACVKKGKKISVNVDPAACVGKGRVLISWPNPDRLAALEARIQALETKLTAANDAVQKLTTQLDTLRTDADATKAFVEPLRPLVRVETQDLAGLKGPHVIFEGANVHVRSGSGDTADGGTPSGLGNLVVGYNEFPQVPRLSDPVRSGSHNLVVGGGHEYTSSGGFVAGSANAISGSGATITGGFFNNASGLGSSVGGGFGNTASEANSTVGGGASRIADLPNSWAAGTLFETD